MTSNEAETVSYYEPTPAEKFTSMFELNEEGRWEVAKRPSLPQLSWSDVDPVEIEQWYQGKVDLETAQGQKWADAWIQYMDAVAEPWNTFVDQAEALALEDDQIRLETDEEVIRFIADNTFVDGVSLSNTYPEIEDWITEMKEEAIQPQWYDWDAAKLPEDGNIMPTEAEVVHHYLQSAYPTEEMEVGYHQTYEPWAIAMEEMKAKVISYGYDPEVAKEWFESNETAWNELHE